MQQNEILRSYGTDYINMTKGLLEAADIASDIRGKCGSSARLHIGIKPNLVCPTPADFGGTTHPEIAAGIIEYLTEHGFNKDEIEILEGSWVGDKTAEAFEYCGYNALSLKYGIQLKDMQKEHDTVSRDCAGMKLNICQHALDLDYLINVPVLKGHCQTKITCALKNMKGLIPNSEKRRFHSLGLHKPIAHLNTVLKPDLIVIDHICGDPDFEEGGNPLTRNCIMLAKDPVLTDAFTAKVLGYKPEEIEYITIAQRLGIGSTELDKAVIRTVSGEVTDGEPKDNNGSEGGSPKSTYREIRQADAKSRTDTRKAVEISYAVEEIDSCSACYGRLIPALDRLKAEGLFDELLKAMNGSKLGIGQGYRGKHGSFGVGNCTLGFDYCIKGCPPESEDIYMALRSLIDR